MSPDRYDTVLDIHIITAITYKFLNLNITRTINFTTVYSRTFNCEYHRSTGYTYRDITRNLMPIETKLHTSVYY